MGTPHFASEILKNLITNDLTIDCVFTQPDRPVGRKGKLQQTPVKQLSQSHSIEVFQFEKMTKEAIDLLNQKAPDFIIVAAYGIILPKEILKIPTFGCINVHASLLPKFRGASPIHSVLLHGDLETGISIMDMDAGVDTGDVYLQKNIAIDPKERYSELEKKLIEASNEVLIPTLEQIAGGNLTAKKQDSSMATMTRMIRKQEGKIDWEGKTAQEIFNMSRAYSIWPNTYAFFDDKGKDKKITLTFLSFDENKTAPVHVGQIHQEESSLFIKTIKGMLLIESVQMEGKGVMSAKDFINGKPTFSSTTLK